VIICKESLLWWKEHSQHFVGNSKLIYFGNHTQTLFCSCVDVM